MKQTTIMERGQRRCRHRRGALEGLENSDMKNVMDPGSLWQTQAIGDLAHAFHNLKRTCIAGTQLPTHTRQKGLSWSVEKTQENPIVDLELQSPVSGIIVPLGVFLRLE